MRFVAEQMELIEPNYYYKAVIASGVKNVMTTNYDLALELGGSDKWRKDNVHRETKYSRYRRNKVDNTCIWYIHGACDAPNTIQLGHEHYSGQLQHLREQVTGFENSK